MQDIERKLYQYQDCKRRIAEIENRMQEIMAKHDSVAEWALRSPRLNDVKVQGGQQKDSVVDAVIRMVDVYGAQYDILREEWVDADYIMRDVRRIVDAAGLTEAERRYTELRYFEGRTPKQIARDMDYSEDHTRKFKNSALEKIAIAMKT
jgi:DNA-directed RNA polymerase specialized sigma24 family protein